MLKMIGFFLGLAGGAGATAGWLLSEPDAGTLTPSGPNDRLLLLRSRFESALAQGKRAGNETEVRLRRELDAYRRDPQRPNPFA